VLIEVAVPVYVNVLVLLYVPVAVIVPDGVIVDVFVGDGGVPVHVCVIVGDIECVGDIVLVNVGVAVDVVV